MRLALLLLSGMLTYALSSAQSIDLFPRELIKQNKVKSLTLYEYDYVGGKPETNGSKAKVIKFDLLGNDIEEVNYRPDGKVHYIVQFKYDDKGNKTEYIRYNSWETSDLQIKYKQNIKLDSKGNVVEELGYNGVENFKVVYNYNPMGKLVEVNYFSLDQSSNKNVLDEKRVLKYVGNINYVKVYNAQSKLQFTLKNINSTTGKILEENRIELDSSVSKRVVYSYDKNDNCISETKYLQGKLASKITRIYNTKGQLIEVYKENSDVDRFLTSKYNYNETDKLISDQTRSEKDNDFSKNSYKYNPNGMVVTIDSYYAVYKSQVLSVYTYENY